MAQKLGRAARTNAFEVIFRGVVDIELLLVLGTRAISDAPLPYRTMGWLCSTVELGLSVNVIILPVQWMLLGLAHRRIGRVCAKRTRSNAMFRGRC